MAINPNPGLITDEMWALWEGAQLIIPGVRLSGIYANKSGYHNSVNGNKRNYPNNYSIKLPLDLVNKNQTKARALDLTMSEKEMIRWTKNMKHAADNPNDTRLYGVKEFYGTLDGKTVFGMAKDSATGRWRIVSSDKSHLWHGHTSIFTAFVADWTVLHSLLSVWKGETFKDWLGFGVALPKLGDVSEDVKYWQYVNNTVRKIHKTPAVVADGHYGKDSAAAFKAFWEKSGGNGEFDGSLITGWLALKYQQALAIVSIPEIKIPEVPAPTFPEDKMEEMITAWLNANVKGKELEIKGDMTGRITL